jgi:hypothetical protein
MSAPFAPLASSFPEVPALVLLDGKQGKDNVVVKCHQYSPCLKKVAQYLQGEKVGSRSYYNSCLPLAS